MKTVEEVRRIRLALLKKEMGTLVALNEKIGLDKRDSTLSQILNSAKNSKTGKGKAMGSPMARKLEAACGKESGWMDTDPDLAGSTRLKHPEVAKTAAALDQLPAKWQKLTLDTVWSAIETAHAALVMEEQPKSPPKDAKLGQEIVNSFAETYEKAVNPPSDGANSETGTDDVGRR